MKRQGPQLAVAGVAGLLFGAGLAISGMLNPVKVLGFLDVTGDWDPSLAFVMGGALLLTTPATWLMRRRETVVAEQSPQEGEMPGRIDRRLLFGAVLFGAGWGLVGLCPGPALASISVAFEQTWLFVVALVAGSVAHRVVE